MRKTLSFILAVCIVLSCLGMFSACGAQEEVGAQGEQGAKGENGQTPFIGTNGNWWIGSVDTGVAAQGPKGDKGDKGEPGEKGDKGEKGDSGDASASVKVKADAKLMKAAFSGARLQMIQDNDGHSYVFNCEADVATIEINVKTPGNRFRVYGSRELVPVENFEKEGYRLAAEIIHSGDDSLTSFTFENDKYHTIMVYMSNIIGAKPEAEIFITPKESEEKAEKAEVSFSPWYCESQPSALGGDDSFADGNWDANEIIENLYEPLRKAYPNYITRENIGKDSSGQYDMWKYVFTPASYNQTIYIHSGVHNREKAALLGLARFLEILCTQWESSEDLAYLYSNVRLVVVPIVNPWGISQENPKNDNNINGINLNRDLNSDSPQRETRNVLKVLDEYKDVLSCAIDFHTTVNSNYGDYAIRWITNAQPNVRVSNDIVAFLTQKNISGTPDLHYHGLSDGAPTYVWYFWNKLGIPGCTLEHADYRWDKNTKYSAICMTRSVELVGNVVINYAKQEFKLHERVNKFFD